MRLAVHTKRRENLIVNNVLGLFGGGSHHGLFGGAGLFSHSSGPTMSARSTI